MKDTFIADIYTYVEDMTGVTVAEIREGTAPADRNLAVAVGRAEAAAAKIAAGRVNPAAPDALRYARKHMARVANEVDRWIAATLGDKGYGPA
ncbi:hypothetical protein [Streptomyces sp. DB-54]